MFDDFSKRSKAVRTAFDLAKERSWGDIRLTDIAQAANLDLSISGASFPARAISSAPSRKRSTPRCSAVRDRPARRKARATDCSTSS